LFIKNKKQEKGEETDTDTVFDTKKSGDFLIYACKHSIRQENYTVSMSLVKVDEDIPEVQLTWYPRVLLITTATSLDGV